MAVFTNVFQVKDLIILTIAIQTSQCINLGLIAGDLKLPSPPLSINKHSRHSPIFININTKHDLLPDLPPLPKLPSKPPPFKLPKLSSPRLKIPKLSSLTPKLSKLRAPSLPVIPPVPLLPPILPIVPRIPIIPKIPVIPKIPFIPKLPLLPIIPPFIPPLPLIPPIIPRFPPFPLTSPFGPLKVPILGKTPLQRALSSELKPAVLPAPSCKRKENIMDKLLELRNKGSLTTGEFLRFKKLLL